MPDAMRRAKRSQSTVIPVPGPRTLKCETHMVASMKWTWDTLPRILGLGAVSEFPE